MRLDVETETGVKTFWFTEADSILGVWNSEKRKIEMTDL